MLSGRNARLIKVNKAIIHIKVMEQNKFFYSISEVAEELGVNTSHLRFLEKEFKCIKPHKNKKGNRSYTAADVQLLRRILYLTKECGYTLEGAREQLKGGAPVDPRVNITQSLNEIRSFLVDLKEQL